MTVTGSGFPSEPTGRVEAPGPAQFGSPLGDQPQQADEPLRTAPAPIVPRGRLSRVLRSRLTWFLVVPFVAVSAAATTLAVVNYLRADEWQQQAVTLP